MVIKTFQNILIKSIADEIVYNRLLCSRRKEAQRTWQDCVLHILKHTRTHICFPSSINSRVGRERVRTRGEVWLRRGEAVLIIWAALQ